MCRWSVLLTPVMFKDQLHALPEMTGTYVYLITASAPSRAQEPEEEGSTRNGRGFSGKAPPNVLWGRVALGGGAYEAVAFVFLQRQHLAGAEECHPRLLRPSCVSSGRRELGFDSRRGCQENSGTLERLLDA